MPMVKMDEFLKVLDERKLIAPAFNTTNLELTLAIIEGAEKAGLPVIVQIAPTNLKLSGSSYISKIVKLAAESVKVPVVLHLDHGMSMDDIKDAVSSGFSSVMIDGSSLSFEENIALTREAVEYCRDFGILVEAELGTIAGKEDDLSHDSDALTNVDLVKEFVEKTGCDMLAVSVGNVHGLDDTPEINLDLLKEIKEKVDIPLVIHGGSGIPDDILNTLSEYGVRKVNIASDLRRKFIESIGKRYVKNPNEYNLVNVLIEAKENTKSVILDKFVALNGEKKVM